jgi:hypothetical protein
MRAAVADWSATDVSTLMVDDEEKVKALFEARVEENPLPVKMPVKPKGQATNFDVLASTVFFEETAEEEKDPQKKKKEKAPDKPTAPTAATSTATTTTSSAAGCQACITVMSGERYSSKNCKHTCSGRPICLGVTVSGNKCAFYTPHSSLRYCLTHRSTFGERHPQDGPITASKPSRMKTPTDFFGSTKDVSIQPPNPWNTAKRSNKLKKKKNLPAEEKIPVKGVDNGTEEDECWACKSVLSGVMGPMKYPHTCMDRPICLGTCASGERCTVLTSHASHKFCKTHARMALKKEQALRREEVPKETKVTAKAKVESKPVCTKREAKQTSSSKDEAVEEQVVEDNEEEDVQEPPKKKLKRNLKKSADEQQSHRRSTADFVMQMSDERNAAIEKGAAESTMLQLMELQRQQLMALKE